MSLQFVLGSAGSGKSYYMDHQITRWARENPDRHYFVIVPEQFNMQTQRDLVRYSDHRGILNVDIVSFPRLADYVFAETGTDPGEVLTDTGKNLILRQVAGQVKDELLLMGGRLDRQGYISQVKSILSEFGQYDISADELDEMIELAKPRKVLHDKLCDIRTLSEAFDQYRQDRFITAEELLKVLARVIKDSALLRGAVMIFDGFTGFTPVQMVLMEELMKVTDRMMIALDIDSEKGLPPFAREHDLFHMTAKTVHALTQVAARSHTDVLESIVLEREGKRFIPGSSLDCLEKNLLRPAAIEAGAECSDDAVRMFRARNPLQEVQYAANQIWKLTRQDGLHYRDIAVIVSDMPTYENHIERIFEQYDLPYFLDRKSSIEINPCLEMIRSAQRIVAEGFSYESMFHFLRTGFTALNAEQIDEMENYVLAAGIRGKRRWMEPWTRKLRHQDDDMLQRCEAARAQIMTELAPFFAAFAEPRAVLHSYAAAIRELLVTLQMTEKIAEIKASLENGESVWMRPEEQRRSMVMEYDQIEEIIDQVIREAEQLLGDQEVEREEFGRILEAGFAEARVGVIPPGLDEVHVGDMIRTRLAHVKVLIFLGANDSFIPAKDSGGGLLSQLERQFFARQQIELAPDARQNSFIQRFYLYQCLTKPERSLYVGYSASDSAGRSMRPSYLVYHLQKIFPQLTAQEAFPENVPLAEQIQTPMDGMRLMAERLRESALDQHTSPSVKEMLRQYGQMPDYRDKTRRLVQAATWKNSTGRLSKEVARRLYEQPLTLSVSKLETFAGCPFHFFAQYGLQLSERDRLKIRGVDTGNFMHDVMQDYAASVNALGENCWKEMSQAQQEELLQTCIDRALSEDAGGRGLFDDSARNRYMAERLHRALRRSIWALTRQIGAGSMVPKGFEVPFRDQVKTLPGGGAVRLVGRIDRIDLYEDEGELYVKVVDYKSSARKVNLLELAYGQQLQLVEYLVQAIQLLEYQHPHKRIVPAGLFYTHLTDPVPEADGKNMQMFGDGSGDERVFLEKMKPEGLVNRNPEVLQMMDEELETRGTSPFIPVKLKKDGGIAASVGVRRAASEEELVSLMHYAQSRIEELEEDILDGEISMYPMQHSRQFSACTFCDYKEVCGFDRRLPGCEVRRMRSLDKDEIWQMIREGKKPEEM